MSPDFPNSSQCDAFEWQRDETSCSGQTVGWDQRLGEAGLGEERHGWPRVVLILQGGRRGMGPGGGTGGESERGQRKVFPGAGGREGGLDPAHRFKARLNRGPGNSTSEREYRVSGGTLVLEGQQGGLRVRGRRLHGAIHPQRVLGLAGGDWRGADAATFLHWSTFRLESNILRAASPCRSCMTVVVHPT